MSVQFNYDDVVRIKHTATIYAGRKAWIIGIFAHQTRPEGNYFAEFPPGIVYCVEFEDGSSSDFHHDDLQLESSASSQV